MFDAFKEPGPIIFWAPQKRGSIREGGKTKMEGYDYAKCIEISKRARWDIDKDVIRAVSLICHRNSFRTASPKWIN